MSLLKIAKEKAETEQKEKRAALKEVQEQRDRLHASLEKLYIQVYNGLKEFDGVECNSGVFKLSENTPMSPSHRSILCIVNGPLITPVLHIGASIISGTYDASDDCRDIPYTSPSVSIQSENKYGYFDFSESVSDTINSDGKVQALLHKTAEYLSKYFKE